ncbi:MAG: alanine racemase [Thermotogaceae bacterium]|nr:alanine racemase [Thermotogaceae bacterium]MDN5337368.1 alanine racemase [Thermotogaceae bacterium]
MRSRKTWVKIDTKAYLENIKYFSEVLFPTKVMPVLKANAYGHGACALARKLEEMKIDYIAVAFLEEALELRKNGIKIPILVFNYFSEEYVEYFVKDNITATIYCFEQVENIESVFNRKKLNGRLKVHINVDTGMGRLGYKVDEALRLFEAVLHSPYFELEGVYTHFSDADNIDSDYTFEQSEKFKEFLNKIPEKPKIIHNCNSAASLFFRDLRLDYSRIGIASYGLQPSNMKKVESIKPVLSWYSVVSFVKEINPGDSISYGRTFIAKNRMKVATIPVGYADGYPRVLSNKGSVLIKGKRCKILGRVCMDQFVVDVSHLKNVKMGDEVVLIGKQGDDEISAEEIAQLSGTINYEIVCGISSRVPRIYS